MASAHESQEARSGFVVNAEVASSGGEMFLRAVDVLGGRSWTA